jgi:hypothetical protein
MLRRIALAIVGANFKISKLCEPFQLSIFIVRLAQVAHITESIHKSHIALLCSN